MKRRPLLCCGRFVVCGLFLVCFWADAQGGEPVPQADDCTFLQVAPPGCRAGNSKLWRVAPDGSNARHNCPHLPPGAIPAPNGYYVRQWQAAQAAKAEADDFVIYKQEWCQGGMDLAPYGRYHLDQIARRLPGVPFPVVIQPEVHPELNEARRQVIVQYLALHGLPDADARVIVAFPQAEGLYGDEAPRIFGRYVTSGTGYGSGGTTFGGGGTSFGGTMPFGGVGGSLGGFTSGGFGMPYR